MYALHLHNVIRQLYSINRKLPYPVKKTQASKMKGSPEGVPVLRVEATMWKAGPPPEEKAQVRSKGSERATGRIAWIQKVLDDTTLLS